LVGKDEVGEEFGKRFEDETAEMRARMREDEGWRVKDEVAVKQDVNVERARGVGKRSFAVVFAFDGLRGAEEFFGRKGSFEEKHGVEEGRGIGRRINGLGFVNGGGGDKPRVWQGGDVATGKGEGLEAVAEI